MLDTNKKIIPKIHRKLSGFLSDEGGKITKEDVLKMGMMAMGIATLIETQEVDATCVWSSASATVTFGNTTGSATSIDNYYTANITNPYSECDANTNKSHMYGTVYTSPGVAPYSRVVNGHANANVAIQGGGFNGGSITTVSSHGSHTSSGSGSGSGSGGWC